MRVLHVTTAKGAFSQKLLEDEKRACGQLRTFVELAPIGEYEVREQGELRVVPPVEEDAA